MIGYAATITKIFKENTDKVFMQLILYVTLPALIIYSMNISITDSITAHFSSLIFLSIFALSISTYFAYVLSKKFKTSSFQDGVFKALFIFGNQGFIGYATLYLVFQDLGIMYGAIYNIPYLFFIWSYGFYVIADENKKPPLINLLLNPGIIATIIGVMLIITPWSLPIIISETLKQIGMMTIPLSMLTIGCIIGSVKIDVLLKLCSNIYVWIVQLGKLIIVPICLIPFIFVGIHPTVLIVAVLLSCMPSAPTTIIFSDKLKADKQLATICVTISSILSMFTIPFVYCLITHFMK